MPLMKFHLATAISKMLRRFANAYNAKLLKEIKDAEVCPHVEVIPGSGKRTTRLAAHIERHGGVIFSARIKTGLKRKYFWHPHERFIPITATAVFQTGQGWKPAPPTGDLCRLCKLCESARPRYLNT